MHPDHVMRVARPTDNLSALAAMAGFRGVPSYNPYWDAHGKTFEGLDGYRAVLQNAAWTR